MKDIPPFDYKDYLKDKPIDDLTCDQLFKYKKYKRLSYEVLETKYYNDPKVYADYIKNIDVNNFDNDIDDKLIQKYKAKKFRFLNDIHQLYIGITSKLEKCTIKDTDYLYISKSDDYIKKHFKRSGLEDQMKERFSHSKRFRFDGSGELFSRTEKLHMKVLLFNPVEHVDNVDNVAKQQL